MRLVPPGAAGLRTPAESISTGRHGADRPVIGLADRVSNTARTKSALANKIRLTPGDSEGIQALRQQLAADKIESFIQKTLASAPPLSAAQCDRIAALLGGDPGA